MEHTATKILCGDAREKLKELPDKSVQMCVTSPPYYGLRNYGVDGQIGFEETPEQYVVALANVIDEVKRVLKPDGTLWVNIGDSYAGSGKGGANYPESTKKSKQATNKGSTIAPLPIKVPSGTKPKDLIGIPWMLAFELRRRGWYLRQDIIWAKPNPMPESVRDRCTKSHEYLFLLSKSQNYFFNHDAMKEDAVYTVSQGQSQNHRYGGNKYTATPDEFYRTKSGNAYAYTGFRNKRDVWSIPVVPYAEAHFATFPEELVKPCILAGSREGDTVLDPFNGAGTTGVVCVKLGRNYIGTELNPKYVALAEKRIADTRLELEYGIIAGQEKKDTFEYESSLFDEMSSETA